MHESPFTQRAYRKETGSKRWSRSFGQVFDIFKWNVRGSHAADLITGSRREVCLIRRLIRQARMGPFPVVQLDVFANGTPGMADRLVGLQVDLFVLDAAPYPLDEHVIAPASLAVHRQPDAPAQYGRGERARRELAALIGVHKVRQPVTSERFFQCLDSVYGLARRSPAEIGGRHTGRLLECGAEVLSMTEAALQRDFGCGATGIQEELLGPLET